MTTTTRKSPRPSPSVAGTRSRSVPPVADREPRPLDPRTAKGRQVAAGLTAVISDVEHAIATRKTAARRQQKDTA